MGEQRRYNKEYKVEAIKLSNKIGTKKAAEELGIPDGTLSGWRKKAKQGKIYLEENEILAEATAFFAASRRKSGKMNG